VGHRISFEKGDRLMDIAKKNDSGELIKLMKRVSPDEDRLPDVVNCDEQTRLYAKIAQLTAIRAGPFTGQFFPCPHNFNLLRCKRLQ